MSELETLPVTFLFTDIARSSQLWEEHPEAMQHALARHDQLLQTAVAENRGRIVKMRGDGAHAVFNSALDAVNAALAGQRALQGESWPAAMGALQIRMGLHTGFAQERDGDYFGPSVNRAVRVQEIAHGGQIVMTQATETMVRDFAPPDSTIHDLGEHQIRDFPGPARVFQISAPDLRSTFPPVRSLSRSRSPVPAQSTPFVGRETELRELDALVSEANTRLVTIVAQGGMGKTRLAMALAERQFESDRFPFGVYYVPLAPLTEPDYIPAAVAKAVEISRPLDTESEEDTSRLLLDHLRARQLLLVMDNFEHLLPGASFVSEMLQAAPGVKIVATSRERLHLQAEQTFHLAGLEFPGDDGSNGDGAFSSVELFVQTAQRANQKFTLDSATAAFVYRICSLVEGMPLAVELAASWLEIMSLEDIAAEIQQGMHLLETENQDVPARQRSIQTVFDTSWRGLSAAEQAVFAELSVFRSGFTRQAAAQVTSATVVQLRSLSGKSLVQYNSEFDRYQIHQLLRRYAASKLAEDETAEASAHARHSAYYCEALGQLESALQSEKRLSVLQRIAADVDNVTSAWQHAVSVRDTGSLSRGLSGISHYFSQHGPVREGERLLHSAQQQVSTVATAHETRVLLARIAALRASLLNKMARYEESAALAQEAIELGESCGNDGAVAQGYLQWGKAHWFRGNYDASRVQLERALECAEAANLLPIKADALRRLGAILWPQGHHAEAAGYFQQALPIFRKIGDRTGESYTLNNLGINEAERSSYASAMEYLRQAASINVETGDRFLQGRVLSNLGAVSQRMGDLANALNYSRQGLEVNRAVGGRRAVAWSMRHLATLLIDVGRFDEARPLLEESLVISDEIGDRRHNAGTQVVLSLWHFLSGNFRRSLEFGRGALAMAREISDKRTMKEALARVGFGQLALGELEAAEASFKEAVDLAERSRDSSLALEPRTGLAMVHQRQGAEDLAREELNAVLTDLDGQEGLQSTEMFRSRLACYELLAAYEPGEAEAFLRRSFNLLEDQAAHFSEGALRRSFLEEVPAHKKIVALYRELEVDPAFDKFDGIL